MLDSTQHEAEYEAPPLPSFVCNNADGSLDLWNPTERTGDEKTDIALGREYAVTVIEFAKINGDHSLIGWTVEAMIRKGFIGPLERGFISVISPRVYVGSYN